MENRLEFTVGRPWGKTAFVTGYTRRNLTFSPLVRQFFTTSTYAGITRKFGEKLTVTALGEYIRSYRVQGHVDCDRPGTASGRHCRIPAQPHLERQRRICLYAGRNSAGLQQFL